MGRPPIGIRPMTKTERQQKWRQGKRAAAAAEIAQAAQAASPHAEARPKPVVDYVIRPEQELLAPIVRPDHGEYTGIIRTVLEFCDGLPQPQVHLLELIQKLQTEYRRRQGCA